ncbi:condensation domain-containing protein [Streptomyces sp. M19]
MTVPPELAAGLDAFCRRDGLTVSTVLYGGWALLLAELCASDDVVFGVTVSGRPANLPGATELVGLLINTVPLRADCAPDSAVLPWLRALQHRLAGMREHGHVPLGRATGRRPHRGADLFDTIVVIENFPTAMGEATPDEAAPDDASPGEATPDGASPGEGTRAAGSASGRCAPPLTRAIRWCSKSCRAHSRGCSPGTTPPGSPRPGSGPCSTR